MTIPAKLAYLYCTVGKYPKKLTRRNSRDLLSLLLPSLHLSSVSFPPIGFVQLLPDVKQELALRREFEPGIIKQLADQALHGRIAFPQNADQVNDLVETCLRLERFRIYDRLLCDCLEYLSTARLLDNYRAAFRKLILEHLGRPDPTGTLDRFEADMQRDLEGFDERISLANIRRTVGNINVRMDILLSEIDSTDLDRYEMLVHQRLLKNTFSR